MQLGSQNGNPQECRTVSKGREEGEVQWQLRGEVKA